MAHASHMHKAHGLPLFRLKEDRYTLSVIEMIEPSKHLNLSPHNHKSQSIIFELEIWGYDMTKISGESKL